MKKDRLRPVFFFVPLPFFTLVRYNGIRKGRRAVGAAPTQSGRCDASTPSDMIISHSSAKRKEGCFLCLMNLFVSTLLTDSLILVSSRSRTSSPSSIPSRPAMMSPGRQPTLSPRMSFRRPSGCISPQRPWNTSLPERSVYTC